jgi:TM2 domain-containing membrane protein YozV
MKQLRKVYIIGLLTSVIFFFESKGQSVQIVKMQADSFFYAQQYKESYRLYNRLAFFADDTLKYELYEKAAISALYIQNYKSAYDLYYILAEKCHDSLYINNKVNQMFAGILANQYEEVVSIANAIDIENVTPVENVKIHFYAGLANIMLHRPELADKSFRSAIISLTHQDSLTLINLLEEYRKKGLINRKKAETLSLIFPGAGQFYLNKPKEALNSIALQSVIVGLLVVTTIEYTILNATLFCSVPFIHYYLGGSNAAGELSVIRQEELDKYYFNRFVNIISTASLTD